MPILRAKFGDASIEGGLRAGMNEVPLFTFFSKDTLRKQIDRVSRATSNDVRRAFEDRLKRHLNRADAPKICNDATLDHFLGHSAQVQTKFYRAESQARLCKEMWGSRKREPAVDVD